ncbi:MAG TPA: ABC transporter substrate-binding protein [Chloroflexota bacterium]|nr:ABC transporter substrate-binding protein [Chloroflexota bacterium]
MADQQRKPASGAGGRRLTRRELLEIAPGVGLGVAAAGLLAGCQPAPAATPSTGGAPAQAPAGQAPAQRRMRDVTFLLDVTPYGKHAFYYAGQDHGEFGRAGFNVKFASAQGSGDCVRKVAAKAADFGLADTGATILARAEGAAAKITFMTHYKNLMSVLSPKKNGIAKPADLEGKTIATTAGDASLVMLPAFAKINNFDAGKVQTLVTDFPSKLPAVQAGRAQGSFDYYTSWPTWEAAGRRQNEEMTALLYADYGLDMYNNGIVVTDDALRGDPSMVKEFLQALAEAIAWCVQDPDAANAITLKYNPALDRDIARRELQVAIDFLMVDEVRRNGIGTMSEDKMRTTYQLVITNYTDMKREVSFDEFWTTEFAPRGVLPKT